MLGRAENNEPRNIPQGDHPMTIRNRKPLIALIVAAGSVLAIPAMAQTAQQSAAQAR